MLKKLLLFSSLFICTHLGATRTLHKFTPYPGGHIINDNAAVEWNFDNTIGAESCWENHHEIDFYQRNARAPFYSISSCDGSIVERGHFSHSDMRFVSSFGCDICMHDSASQTLLYTLSGAHGTDGAIDVLWSHDDTRFLSTGFDHRAIIWDADAARQLLVLTGHQDGIVTGAWSNDDKRVATASYDGTVLIWDARSGKCLANLDHTYEGHTMLDHQYVRTHPNNPVLSVAWSHDDKMVATVANDRMARVWWPKGYGHSVGLAELNRPVKNGSPLYFSPSNEYLMAFGPNKTFEHDVAQIYEIVPTGDCVLRLAPSCGGIATARWGNEGTIITEHFDNTAALWQFNKNQLQGQ